MKVAVIPGKFNPVHRGHVGIMEDASKLFDRIVVAVECDNIQKSMKYYERVEEALRRTGAPKDQVIVLPYNGSFVEFVNELMAKDQENQEINEYAIVKGLRNINDFENKKAWIVDYKTGSNKYPDTDQLELMALLTFAHYPDIDKVNAALLFVVKESITKLTVRREDAEKLWWKYRERVAKIESSHSSGVWNPKQSGLCKWCAVTSCEFNPKH